jgi:hypothetical protein
MSLLDWAKNEIELACKRERGLAPTDEFDYGCACYESALKAFGCLCEEGHSGASIEITKTILNRLIEGKCLTPIYDTPEEWNEVWSGDVYTEYQCRRMNSLFKRVYTNGTVKYRDINRFVGTYEGSKCTYYSGHINRVMEKMYPLTMPYMPENKPYYVYSEDFLVDPANGDYDTVGYLYCIEPDGTRTDLNKYFKESDTNELGFVEISRHEYLKRKRLAEKRVITEGRSKHEVVD